MTRKPGVPPIFDHERAGAPVLRIPLELAQVKVVDSPVPGRKELIIGPMVTFIILPLDSEAAKSIGRQLSSGILVP